MRLGIFLWALLACVGLEARFYFIHVPKTGGTTLRYLLEMQVASDEIYPHRIQRWAQDPIRHNLVSGHLPCSLCAQLDPDFEKAFKVTILRDPIERYLSFLRAKRRNNDRYPNLESVMERRFSPNNPYKLGLLDNALCRFFADRPNLEGEELLASAKKGLEQFDCILFLDNFSQDVVDLFLRLGISLDKNDIPKMNATQKEPVSHFLLEEIRKQNLWDLELYQYAKENIRKKKSTYSLRGASFKKTMRPSAQIDYRFDCPLLGTGWSYRQKIKEDSFRFPIYRWVLDRPASIYLPLLEGKEYTLSFSARPYEEGQSIGVTVNGHEVELERKKEGTLSLYSAKIKREWLLGSLVEVTFHPQKAFLYPTATQTPHLFVSFAIHRIEIH